MRRSLQFILMLTAVVAAACSSDDGGELETDAGDGPDAGPDYRDADYLFEPDRLLEIDIEIEERDWDTLRFQTRNILDLFGMDCGVGPAVSPFTYVPATVTVEGETITNVGLRKKGFLGSLDETKPSLKIKFNEYEEGQRFSGLKRMTLNNARQDPGFLNQCLGYALFNQAGVPAPRCNYAHVTLNGRDMGVYVHIESVKKPFLGLHFDDNDGNLYEGTLSDFRDGWITTFERKTNKSEPEGTEDRSDLAAIADALELGDAAMVTALEELIDLDAFYTFWALESMVSHWDGYSGNNNNFFMYNDPTSGKFHFMPWGADALFGNGAQSQDPAATRSTLTRRLYLHPPTRAAYLQRYEELLDNVWDDDALLAEVDRMETLISSTVRTEGRAAFNNALAALRAHLNGREQILRTDLASAGAGDAEELMDPFCFDEVGQVTATFTASYNGGASGAVTMGVTVSGATRTLSNLVAYTGTDGDNPDHSVLIMTANDDLGRDVVFYMSTPDSQVAAGNLAVGSGRVESVIFFQQPGAMDPEEVYFLAGTLDLSTAATTPGASWQGDLDVSVWDPPFF